ncbi:ubiquitin-protein ligase (E3), partial [Coemansia biformis]
GGDAEGGDAEDAESDSSGVDDADHSSDEADPAPGLDNIIDILLAGDQVPGSRQDWMMHTYSSFVRQRQRQQRAEQLVMRPRIAVLRRIPFVVPFNDRVRLFHALINRDRARLGIPPIGRVNGPSPFDAHTAAHAVVRRGNVFNDGFSALFPALSGKPARTRPVGAAAGSGLLPGTGSDASPARVPFPDRDMMFPVRPPGPSQVRDLFEESPDFFRMPMMDEIGSRIRSPISQRDMFKYRIQISFVDEHGMPEAGVDGGGVFKEFLTSLVREAFDPRMGLFCATRSNSIYPDPDSVLGDDEHRRLVLEKYKFLGAVIGKALYEGVLVDAPFALFFLGYCVGKLPEFNDLPTLDEDLYRGLVALKNYPTGARAGAAAASKRGGGDGGEGDEDDEIYKIFGLDFTTTVGLRGGQTKTVPLVPRGDTIRVTSHNRLLYLDLVAQHKLVKQIGAQVRAFVAGLHTVIPENWLRLLFASPLELSRLLCGDAGVIDVADWQRNTLYSGAFGDQGRNHPTVQAFWSVVEHELSEAQRRELCRFATSCERPPLLGFAELNPQFCISGTSHANEDGSSIETRLPSASTCVNLLKLPAYRSRQVLHDKLVTAIDSHAGFDLS